MFATEGIELYNLIKNKKDFAIDFEGVSMVGISFLKQSIGKILEEDAEAINKFEFFNVNFIIESFLKEIAGARKNENNNSTIENIVEEEKKINLIEEYKKSIPDFIENFNAVNTKVSYEKTLNYFFKYATFCRIDVLDKNVLKKYQLHLQEKEIKTTTINLYLISLKEFVKYLFENEKIDADISNVLKLKSVEKQFKKPIFKEWELKQLLTELPRNTAIEKRDFAVINLLARTGLRTCEVIEIKWEDIKEENSLIKLYIKGKGRREKEEYVMLTEEAYGPLKALRIENKGYVFKSESIKNKGCGLSTSMIRRIVKEALRKCGLREELSAHSFRHTFATMALKNGADLYYVQQALRHRSITTSELYLKPIEREEKAAEKFIKI